jgi:hypothetical protein
VLASTLIAWCALVRMSEPSAHDRRSGSRALLRWIFERGHQRLTCRVDQQPETGFTLSLLPHSRRAIGVAETFTSAWSAFQRHAMIASELRGAGWTLGADTAD